MSNYIKIPTRITELKNKEALVYAYIRNEIKDNTRKASMPEAEIAEKMSMSEKQIWTYVNTLRNEQYFDRVDRIRTGEHPYNVYHLPELNKDYFIVLLGFLNDQNLSCKEKNLMLKFKAMCNKGTNHIEYNETITDIKKKLGIGKNSKELENLIKKGYLRNIGKKMIITNENFPLYYWDNVNYNKLYKNIYKFCMEQDIAPPERNNRALSMLFTKYNSDPESFRENFQDRLKKLPKDVDLNYFCKILTGEVPAKKTKHKYTYTM